LERVRERFFERTKSGSSPAARAAFSTIISMPKLICCDPKPRIGAERRLFVSTPRACPHMFWNE
jgi:hypothetical protein